MYKNQASQYVIVFAWDTANDTEKTGDAANITAYISKDTAAAAQSNDVNPTELDATNLPGHYAFLLTQAESNCDLFDLHAKSATSDVKIEPVLIYTVPAPGSSTFAESYGAKGAARTHTQLLHEILSLVANKAVVTTTLTSKKLDTTTTAKTYTLSDATSPTSIVEAT